MVYINGAAAPRTPEGVLATPMPRAGGRRRPISAVYSTERLPNGKMHPVVACANGQGTGNDTGVYVVPPGCYFMMGDKPRQFLGQPLPALSRPGVGGRHAQVPVEP